MDAAIMDLSKAFEYGQGYVALSRVRRLSGVYLTGLNERALHVHPEILQKDAEFRAASDAARETFSAMPATEVLAMQQKFVKAMGGALVDENTKNEARNPKEKTVGLPGRLAKTLQAARDNRSILEVAKACGLAVSTVATHLEELADIGKLTRSDFIHLIPPDALDEIHEALDSAVDDKLSPVFHALGGRYSFETIRLTRLASK